MTEFREDMTVKEARAVLRTLVRDGAECPVCRQHAEVYRRKLNKGMALSLVTMYRAARRDWQHVPTTVGGRSREEGKLRYWGLVEEEQERRDDGGRAGVWRVTETGEAWLRGEVKVRSHAVVYDGRLLRLEGAEIGPGDALGEPFDLGELRDESPLVSPSDWPVEQPSLLPVQVSKGYPPPGG